MPLSSLIETSQFKRILVRALALPLITMAMLATILFWLIREQTEAAGLVERTDRVIGQGNRLLKLLVDMETGERGYLVGKDRRFLQPYINAEKQIMPSLDNLERLVYDNPDQQKRLAAIRVRYAEWMANAQQEISMRNTRPDYQAIFNRGKGKTLMDNLRAQIGVFIGTEEFLRAERTVRARNAARITLFATVGLILLLGGLLTFFLRSQLLSLSGTYERATSRLVESEQQLSTTLTSIGDAVLATDKSGNVRFMNPAAESLTGWTREEATGKAAAQVVHLVNEETRQAVENPVDIVIREGIKVSPANHTLLLHKTGTETPIVNSAAPIHDARGNLLGAVLVFHDISSRKAQEARILSLNKRLQAAMEETHHRFRNGLQILTALVELQQSEHEDTVTAHELKRLNNHIQTLNIIHSILMAQARKDGDATSVPVKDLLNRMLPHLQRIAPDSPLFSTIDDVILSTQQATSLGLIINELILNAARSVCSEIKINFTVQGDQAVLEITDDGPGLPDGFDPRRFSGLALVDTLAHWDLKGRIDYSTQENGGATAVLTMPISVET
jgi:PAS domain S-box-containing protein